MTRTIFLAASALAAVSTFGAAGAQEMEYGQAEFLNSCAVCHGDSVQAGGIITDLRWATAPATKDTFAEVVIGGKYATGGMASFAKVLSSDDVESIRAYIINRANEDAAAATPQ